jgi:hypothetical protein
METPAPPEGEADLRALAEEFMGAEGTILSLLASAAAGRERGRFTELALRALIALRSLDFRRPVFTAYAYQNPDGTPAAVQDLADGLALRLDRGVVTASDGVRDSFRRVTPDNLSDLTMSPLTAAIDSSGHPWALGSWAQMNTSTSGRHATSRGLADWLGPGYRIQVKVGRCQLCARHAGYGHIGETRLPPFHPNCSCVAVPAE